jgi:hypothetical protein
LAVFRTYAGKVLFDPTNPGTPDRDSVDAKWLLHPIQNEVLNLISIALRHQAVYVKAAAALIPGPVRVTGYDPATNAFIINTASCNGQTVAHWMIDTAIALNGFGLAYVGGLYTSTFDSTLVAIGSEMYLDAAGGITNVAPVGANQFVQPIGRTKTQGINAVIAGMIGVPIRIGTSFYQSISVTDAVLAFDAAVDANRAVGTNHVKDLAITTAKLAAAAVTLEKLESRARPVNNALINSQFDFFQRFLTPGSFQGITDGNYGPDRGIILGENGDAPGPIPCRQINLETNTAEGVRFGLEIDPTATGALKDKAGYLQIIQASDCHQYRNRTCIFQARVKAPTGTRQMRMAILEWKGTADSVAAVHEIVNNWDSVIYTAANFFINNANLTVRAVSAADVPVTGGSFVDISLTATIGNDAKNIFCFIWNNDDAAGGLWQMIKPGFYDGDQVREWLPRLESTEFNLCLRRCFRLFNTATLQYLVQAFTVGTTAGLMRIQHPVGMAYAPIFTASNFVTFAINDGTTTIALTAITPSVLGNPHMSMASFTLGSPFGINKPGLIISNTVAAGSAWMLFEAEL